MNEIPAKEERLWGMLCHLSVFSAHFIPLGNIIAPLIIWQIKKEDSSFIAYHGKEALNFQISIIIYISIAAILSFFLIGLPLLFGLWIFSLIIVIIAALKANDGQYYRYPLTIRFIK